MRNKRKKNAYQRTNADAVRTIKNMTKVITLSRYRR